MRTIKLTIAYDGTDFKGWQIQKNGNTVQAELEAAIEKVTQKHSRAHASGRTDAGVHAKGQVVHFKTASTIPDDKLPLALNAVLPETIAVLSSEEVKGDFHSQYDARKKLYRYCIFPSGERDPFIEKYAWRIPYKLNVSKMKREALVLLGKQDFKAFQAKDKRERSSVRNVYLVDIKKKSPLITIDIEANGFLYNMVRNITGTLVDLGRGYLPEGSMRKIIDSKDRTKAGPTAPAKGLFLINVKY